MTKTEAKSPERMAAAYWRERDDGGVELIASRCRDCGTLHLPAVAICAECAGDAFEPKVLGPSGSLYSYTIVRTPGPGFPPVYAVGYVDFPEGVRVFGHVRMNEDDELRLDMPVTIERAVLLNRADGTPVHGYRFVPEKATS